MRIVLRAACAALFVVLGAAAAQADYLNVNRPATIKSGPDSSATVLEHLGAGAHLSLLENATQTSGYYHVVDPRTSTEGWIFHTLVSVETGDIAGANPPATPAAPATPQPSGSASGAGVVHVHYINMGQGNSTLLEFSCGAMLIDAGGQNQDTTNGLIAYLHAFFARRPDLNNTLAGVIITHTHVDHNLALTAVAQNFAITHYIYNGHLKGSGRVAANWMVQHANDDGRHTDIEAVTETDVERAGLSGLTDGNIEPLSCAGTTPAIHIMAGPYPVNPGWSAIDYANENNASLVIRVDFGQASFLFPGDQEDAAIAAMLKRYDGTQALKSDVYEVGHHGSYNGTDAPQLAAIAPKIAVISMGDSADHRQWTAWQYGHPRKTTIDLLEGVITNTRPPKTVPVATAAKAFTSQTVSKAIYATGWDGTIDITADAAGQYSVQTEH